MTTAPPIIEEVETFVHRLAGELTGVRPRECLCCYTYRQLEQFGCDGTLRHALRYRDAVAPRATALAQRLGRVGGYCDCELFLNGYEPHPRLWTPEREDVEEGIIYDAEPPEQLPPCAGVGRGAVRPCDLWVRPRRR